MPPPAHGRSKKTIANLRSTLKAALFHGGADTHLPPRGAPLTADWARHRDSLTELRLKRGLSKLIRIASHKGLPPGAMSESAFQRIADVVKLMNWGWDARPFERDVPRLWNDAASTVPGWPNVLLTAPETVPESGHLTLSAFPESFQRDVERYLAWAGGSDPLAPDAPNKTLRASTLRLRKDQLRIAASTLARELGGAQKVATLADLVQPEHVKLILTKYFRPDEAAKSTAFVRGLSITLKAVAKTWTKSPQASLDELARLHGRLGGERAGLTQKNRAVIRQFSDPRLLVQLLGLPAALRKNAQAPRMSPSRKLQKAGIALAIDKLLVAPIRVQNLASLRLDRQLQSPNGRQGTMYITLNEDETKNAQPLEYPLPDSVRDALHEYVDRYRPHAESEGSPWLFVTMGGSPVPTFTLRDGIKKAIRRGLGVDVTPHQFRHLAAAIALDAQPGALGLVKDLLGHKNIKTTQSFYAGMRTRHAGREYDKILGARRELDAGAH